ncbi:MULTISPECIES: hypothetical protein [unclassified Streptomyces]|uniref:hypothetical protein n=1 Tax=unclassified Streptomyces TaxID=2593676 RepID=UPI002366FD31|nr:MULTISPECIES: hypothetical protein [unclassified Streptomyces]MDF3142894.1 hypothetical protein [Streptomyces sp. T21Q-yed]WDF39297.1 hypothetical protein PBV52_22065 [Streptomyces sp. T12]
MEWPTRALAERIEQDRLHHEAGHDRLEAFFLERLATAEEYLRLALIDDNLVEYDDWLTLLRRAGLTG